MLCPAVGDRLRVRPPLREVVVRPPPDPADATEREDREGGRLFGVIMLLGMLTGRTESVGVEAFLGGAEDIVDGADGRVSSSFFSSTIDTFEMFKASLAGFVAVFPSFPEASFDGETCVAILKTYLL